MPEDFDINNIINDGAEPDPASVQLPEHNHDPEITADQSAADPMLIIPEATEIADPLEGEEISVEEILKEANRVLGNNVDVHNDPAFEQDDHDIGSDDAGRFAEDRQLTHFTESVIVNPLRPDGPMPGTNSAIFHHFFLAFQQMSFEFCGCLAGEDLM